MLHPTKIDTAAHDARVAALNARLLTEQNLPLAIAAGTGAALVGALLWMGITVATGMQVGYVALAVGAGVGYAVRYAGKGRTRVFGVVGGLLTLLACVAWQMLAILQEAANENGASFFQAVSAVNLGQLAQAMITDSSPISYLIYAVGIYEGYQFSFRKVTPAELAAAGLA